MLEASLQSWEAMERYEHVVLVVILGFLVVVILSGVAAGT